jgi:hypothetical protein
MFERGIELCHEIVRFRSNRFGPMLVADIRRQRVSRIRADLGPFRKTAQLVSIGLTPNRLKPYKSLTMLLATGISFARAYSRHRGDRPAKDIIAIAT